MASKKPVPTELSPEEFQKACGRAFRKYGVTSLAELVRVLTPAATQKDPPKGATAKARPRRKPRVDARATAAKQRKRRG